MPSSFAEQCKTNVLLSVGDVGCLSTTSPRQAHRTVEDKPWHNKTALPGPVTFKT
jgi:hypothetical protein